MYVVTTIPWRKVFKKKNLEVILTCTIYVVELGGTSFDALKARYLDLRTEKRPKRTKSTRGGSTSNLFEADNT
jgi:hypothetical protein